MILDIDKFIQSPPQNRVHRIGVELEGGWSKIPKNSPGVHQDNSVKGFPADIVLQTGEIASPPIPKILVRNWIIANYPTHINKTCGLHVHQSFAHALDYMRLMDESYQDTMLAYLKKWAEGEKLDKAHPFWERIEGKCEHCQLKFWPDKQVRQARKIYDKKMDGHRYTAVNYCHALNNMGTLEIRVLPMFDSPQQSARAVLKIIDITNACLVRLAKKEKKVDGNFEIDPEMAKPVRDEAIAVL